MEVSGNQLTLGGVPWRAVGVNFWDMDAARVVSGDFGGCYYQHADLDSYFDSSFRRISENTAATAVRTFGFLAQYTGGANPDWSSTDKLLHYARKYNVRVVPVLGVQSGTCGEAFKTPEWYHCTPSQPADCIPGYKKIGPWGTSYRDYVVSVVLRYKGDPTIAFWQLMNEAFVVGATSDPAALADFASDMMQAVRTDAGDSNHLVSLGTVGANAGTGSQLDPYRKLLECSLPCPEIAGAHYYGAEALQGMPAESTLSAEVVADLTDPRGVKTNIENRTLLVDGWRTVEATIYNPQVDPRISRSWGIRVKGAATSRWSVQIDHVVVTTAAGTRIHEFEIDEEGFDAQNASTVARTTDDADTGMGSLRVVVDDPATSSMLVTAPAYDVPVMSVSLRFRVNFTGPLAQPLNGLALASYLREATVTHGVPFVATELGAWQEIAPYSPDGHTLSGQSLCASRALGAAAGARVPYSAPHRALIVDDMLALQFNPDHFSSGALIWDWKDPGMLVTQPDGTPAVDPTINCFTITPGDPSEAIIMKWASRTPGSSIGGSSSPVEAPQRRFTGLPAPATVKAGAAFALKGRVTLGGNPVAAAGIVTSGCSGSATTDSLGHGTVVCRIDAPGTYTITLAGNAQCACPGSRTYFITVTA